MTETEKMFTVGDRVRLVARPPYIKTADPMPMLRPPDIVQVGEQGVVFDQRMGNTWGVRFDRGKFLLDSKYLELATADTAHAETPQSGPLIDSTSNLDDDREAVD